LPAPADIVPRTALLRHWLHGDRVTFWVRSPPARRAAPTGVSSSRS